MAGEDLGAPRPQCLAQRLDLLDRVGRTARDHLVQQQRGVVAIVGEVDVTDGFFGEPRAEHFVVGVTDPQSKQEPVRAAFVEAFRTGEQQLADPIQRIGLATAVAERLVLDAASDLVETAVRDAHDVERIRDPACVIQVRGQSRPERLGEIGHHDFDAPKPCWVGAASPSAQVSGSFAFDHVDHDRSFEINEPSRIDRRVLPVRLQERRLINTELGDSSDSVGVIHQWGAVFDHCVHDRPPTHPELTSDTRDRSGVLTDLAACLAARPAREHHLRVHITGVFGPGLRVARRLDATPPALDPHQPRRTAEARKVTDRDRHPILRLGAHAAPRATDEFGIGFDRDHHLIGVSVTSRTRNPSSPSSASARPIPSVTSGVSSSSQPSNSRNDGGTPGPRGGPPLPHVPHLNAKSQ